MSLSDPKKEHYDKCCVGNIEWDAIEVGDGGVYYPGVCTVCGTEYEGLYIPAGIVEKESQTRVDD